MTLTPEAGCPLVQAPHLRLESSEKNVFGDETKKILLVKNTLAYSKKIRILRKMKIKKSALGSLRLGPYSYHPFFLMAYELH